MATWGIYAAIGIIAFLIIARIPGFSVLMMPLAMAIGGIVTALVTSSFSWLTFVLKVIIRAHHEVLTHLLHEEEHFNIKLRIKNREDRQ